MDLIDPAWVADLFDRPEENPLGAILVRFGSKKDTDRRFWARPYSLPYAQHDTLRLHTCAGGRAADYRQKACQFMTSVEQGHRVYGRQQSLQARVAGALADG